MKRLALYLFLATILASPALAWTSGPDGSRNVGFVSPSSPVAHYDFAAAGGPDSGWLAVSQCSTISVYFDPDEDGALTGATVKIREASEVRDACTDGTILTVDVNADGDITAADEVNWTGAVGLRGFRGVRPGGTHICVDVIANATPDDARVTVVCRP